MTEESIQRSPGGKLALWVFYAFCIYFIWMMTRYCWVVSDVEALPGATTNWSMVSGPGKWLGALLGAAVLGSVGALLGAIAWYTRPRKD